MSITPSTNHRIPFIAERNNTPTIDPETVDLDPEISTSTATNWDRYENPIKQLSLSDPVIFRELECNIAEMKYNFFRTLPKETITSIHTLVLSILRKYRQYKKLQHKHCFGFERTVLALLNDDLAVLKGLFKEYDLRIILNQHILPQLKRVSRIRLKRLLCS